MDNVCSPAPLPELLHPYEASPDYRVARCAVTAAGLKKVARVPERAAAVNTAFTVQVTPQGAITNQKRSGRCWMFAALNVFRRQVMLNANLETFEFSQAWTLYWDKLERTNWFLNQMVALIDEPLEGRVMSFMLTDPLCDGGQWDMLVSLVKTYGLVPKEAMPETECSSARATRPATMQTPCARRSPRCSTPWSARCAPAWASRPRRLTSAHVRRARTPARWKTSASRPRGSSTSTSR